MATVEEVLAEEDATSFAIALSNLVFPRWDRDGYSFLTPAERGSPTASTPWSARSAMAAIRQFFDNSSGDTAMDTVAALDAIGAGQAAALVRRAVAMFPGSDPPRDRDTRYTLMEQLPAAAEKEWSALDDQFYAYPDDLTSLLRRYVATSAASFGRGRDERDRAMVDAWPFEDSRNTASITTRQVLDGAPVLLVTHDDDDGSWQFLCGTTDDPADARVVGLGEMYKRDPESRSGRRSAGRLAGLAGVVGWAVGAKPPMT